MLKFLRSVFNKGQTEMTTGLTAEQACAIAENEVKGSDWAGQMTMSTTERRDEKLVWIIGSPTVGSGMTVTIDDASGTVISCGTWGVR